MLFSLLLDKFLARRKTLFCWNISIRPTISKNANWRSYVSFCSWWVLKSASQCGHALLFSASEHIHHLLGCQDVCVPVSNFPKGLIKWRRFLLPLALGIYRLSGRLSSAQVPQNTSQNWKYSRDDCFLNSECSKSRMDTTRFLHSAPEYISAPGDVLSQLKCLNSVHKFAKRWVDVCCWFSSLWLSTIYASMSMCVFSCSCLYISSRAAYPLLKYLKTLLKAPAPPDMFVLWPLITQNPSRQVGYPFGFASRPMSGPGPICSNASIHFPTSELSKTTVLLIHDCFLASRCPNWRTPGIAIPCHLKYLKVLLNLSNI